MQQCFRFPFPIRVRLKSPAASPAEKAGPDLKIPGISNAPLLLLVASLSYTEVLLDKILGPGLALLVLHHAYPRSILQADSRFRNQHSTHNALQPLQYNDRRSTILEIIVPFTGGILPHCLTSVLCNSYQWSGLAWPDLSCFERSSLLLLY